MTTEQTLNGYCMAMAEANGKTNHGCEFSFQKVNLIGENLEETLTEHFRATFKPEYSDFKELEEAPISLDVLSNRVKWWFNSKEILEIPYKQLKNGSYELEENTRTSRFLELLEEFQGDRTLTIYKIKGNGDFFILYDYFLLQLDNEFYTLEMGAND
jgi:hypothetical protein